MPGTLRTLQTVSASQLQTVSAIRRPNMYGWPGTSDHYYALQMKASA
jgi:hypothetical protein